MTTTLMPPESTAPATPATPVTDPYQPVSIRANLLPPEILESRRTRKVRRIVIAALVVLVVLLGGWYALASYAAAAAGYDVARADSDVDRLAQQQKVFAPLISTQAQSKAINAQLSALLADDLQWGTLLSSLQSAAPSGVQITDISGSLKQDSAATGSRPAGSTQPSKISGQALIGNVTVNGTGTSKAAVAAYLDALTKVSGLVDPYLTSSTREDGVERFTVQLDITSSALGGRYTSHSANGSGGK